MKVTYFIILIIIISITTWYFLITNDKNMVMNNTGVSTINHSINSIVNASELVDGMFINYSAGYQYKVPSQWFLLNSDSHHECLLEGASNCIEEKFSSVEPGTVDGAYSDGFDISVLSYNLDQNVSLEEIFDQDEDIPDIFNDYSGNTIIGPEMLVVDGRSAIHYSINAVISTEPSYIEEILIRNGGQVIDIEAIVLEKSEFEKYRQDFDIILNSFSFSTAMYESE